MMTLVVCVCNCEATDITDLPNDCQAQSNRIIVLTGSLEALEHLLHRNFRRMPGILYDQVFCAQADMDTAVINIVPDGICQ